MFVLFFIYSWRHIFFIFFNSDPHPVNIFVTIESRTTPPVDGPDDASRDSDDEDSAGDMLGEASTITRRVRPVLLDFGMTVEISEKERLAYAKLVSDLSNLDFSGLSQTLREVGCVLTFLSQAVLIAPWWRLSLYCNFGLFFAQGIRTIRRNATPPATLSSSCS